MSRSTSAAWTILASSTNDTSCRARKWSERVVDPSGGAVVRCHSQRAMEFAQTACRSDG